MFITLQWLPIMLWRKSELLTLEIWPLPIFFNSIYPLLPSCLSSFHPSPIGLSTQLYQSHSLGPLYLCPHCLKSLPQDFLVAGSYFSDLTWMYLIRESLPKPSENQLGSPLYHQCRSPEYSETPPSLDSKLSHFILTVTLKLSNHNRYLSTCFCLPAPPHPPSISSLKAGTVFIWLNSISSEPRTMPGR
jgi:hypothetical protein